jgi:hypothetical protein
MAKFSTYKDFQKIIGTKWNISEEESKFFDWRNIAVRSLVPNAQFSENEGGINWNEDENGGAPCPSDSEINTEIIRLKALYTALKYARDRQDFYPSTEEQLDLLYHDMIADKGDKTGEWFKAVKKVKDDNAKP